MSFQVFLMLMVQGPCFENHWFGEIEHILFPRPLEDVTTEAFYFCNCSVDLCSNWLIALFKTLKASINVIKQCNGRHQAILSLLPYKTWRLESISDVLIKEKKIFNYWALCKELSSITVQPGCLKSDLKDLWYLERLFSCPPWSHIQGHILRLHCLAQHSSSPAPCLPPSHHPEGSYIYTLAFFKVL